MQEYAWKRKDTEKIGENKQTPVGKTITHYVLVVPVAVQ